MTSVIENPTSSQNIGSFNNVAYVRHKGRFVGSTVSGKFSVPYEITAPVRAAEGNRTFVFEPPHFTSGTVARDVYLGPGFLLNRGFGHASVGYGNLMLRSLDPNPGFPLVIHGREVPVVRPGQPGEVTDDNILRQFAYTLRNSPPAFLGRAERIFGIGFSDSGNTVQRIYEPFGQKLFDITFGCTAGYFEPVRGEKPIIVFNTESDFDVRTAPKPSLRNYRCFAVAGAPHIPDTVRTRAAFPDPPPPFSPAPPVAGTTPLDWVPSVKALFVAGDEWVRKGTPPPASNVLKVVPGGLIARDVAGNAVGGIRHPALDLKEATFIASIVRGQGWELFGAYSNPRRVPDFDAYLASFRQATEELRKARLLLRGDQLVLNQRAALHAPDTYTLNYMRGRFFTIPTPSDEDALLPLTSPTVVKEQDLQVAV